MTSDQKLQANRRNALKSTGPRSAGGKARVSQNAARHGVWSKITPEDVARLSKEFPGLFATLGPASDELRAQVIEALVRERRIAAACQDVVEAAESGDLSAPATQRSLDALDGSERRIGARIGRLLRSFLQNKAN